MTPVLTIPKLFDVLGGPAEVSRWLGVGMSTATEMKRRKSIPVKYWPRIISLALKKNCGLTRYQELAEMHLGRQK